MSDKCICHINGYEIKDHKARNDIKDLTNLHNEDLKIVDERINEIYASGGITENNLSQHTLKRLNKLDGLIFNPEFEIGSIFFNNGEIIYQDNTMRVRTKEGNSINLKVGTRISLSDYTKARYYLGWYDSNGTLQSKGWLTRDYIVELETNYFILIAFNNERQLNEVSELSDLLNISYNFKTIWNNPIFFNDRVNLIAHKGLSGLAPANTVPSFELAGKNKFFFIETDIWNTADNNIVCIHDWIVDTTTNGTGIVTELTTDEIKQFNITTGNNLSGYENLTIPTFDEYLTVCKKYNAIACVDVKTTQVERTIPLLINKLKEYGMYYKAIIILPVEHAGLFRGYDEYLPICLVVNSNVDYVEIVNKYYPLGNIIFNFNYSTNINKELITLVHNYESMCWCWTLDNLEESKKLLALGIDGITTNLITSFD